MAITVSIVDGSWTVNKSDGRIQITLVTSEPVPLGELLLVDFEIVPGTALPKEDYQYLSPSAVFVQQTGVYADRVSIPSGASIGSILIDILQDEIAEGDENFIVNLTEVSPNFIIGANASTAITILDDDISTVLYRVNAGGPDITAIDGGPNWLSDDAFLLNSDSTDIYKASVEVDLNDTVPDTTPKSIFDTERFGVSQGTDDVSMQYAFAVDPGVYEVRLYLANTFDGTSLPGERIFDVAIEDQILHNLNDIDPSAKFGHLVGGFLSNKIEVKDNILNINFFHDALNGIENPFVNAIEIVQLNDGDLLPTVSLASSSSLVKEGERFAQFTLITSEPVSPEENVTITFEIVPDSANPLEDYVYESATATFDPATGIYTDTATIPSGFSVASIFVDILEDSNFEGDEVFTINITNVDSYFEIGENSSSSVRIEGGSFNQIALGIEAEDIVFSSYQNQNISTVFGSQVPRYYADDFSVVGVSTMELNDLDGFVPGLHDIAVDTLDHIFAIDQSIPQLNVELNKSFVEEMSLQTMFIGEAANLSTSTEQFIATDMHLGAGDILL